MALAPVVRAPIAPQLIRPATYRGLTVRSRNSGYRRAGPCRLTASSSSRARLRPLLIWQLRPSVRVADQSLPADRGARLEVHPHHDQQIVFQLIAYREQAGVSGSPPCRVLSTG